MLFKPVGIDPELGRTRLGQRQGGGRGLFHDIAEGSGELEIALAGEGDRLDQQHVAADRCVGETSCDADAVGFQRTVGEEHGRTEEALDRCRRDAVGGGFFFGHLHRHLAAHRRDLAFEVAKTRLAGVAGDQPLQGRGGERQSMVGESVLLDLTRNQVTAGDLELFLFGVAGEVDHLHPVEEGGLDRLRDVAGGDKEHLREIVDNSQVVIAEGVVLLGVENLEEGGRRISPDVRTELVDLVEHEDRV